MTTMGRFIVLEGLEGAGKSTAISTIKRFLAPFVPELVITREPGGTEVGEAIRQMIKNADTKHPLSVDAELLLFFAARAQLVKEVIMPSLQRGAWVLADRFDLSTFAYQGAGRYLDLAFIETLSQHCLQGLQPDLLIFLDISPEIGLKRAEMRGKADRIEAEPLSFFKRVYDGYHTHLKRYPCVEMIDASLPLGEVQYRIKNALRTYMKTHA